MLDLLIDHAIAMDVALKEVCSKQGIDVMTIKKLALCENEVTFTESNKPELVKEYVGLFMAIVGVNDG